LPVLDDDSEASVRGNRLRLTTRSALVLSPPAVLPRPFITFARPDREHEALAPRLERAAASVIRRGRAILDEEVEAFERELAAFVGAKFAIGTSSGTDALVTALHALDVGPGDEVIVAAFGFVAGAEAIVRVGATPVFVDIEPVRLGLDAACVSAALSARTAAIFSTDLFGVVHDLRPLRQLAPTLPIVEDAAQAFGSSLGGVHAGCHGDIGTFSFYPSKTLGAVGDAGACVTREASLKSRIAQARSHGASSGYEWEAPGGNYRLDELQAALLRIKLAHVPARLERRRVIGNRLITLARRHGAEPIVGEGVTCHAPLAIRVTGGRRDDVLEALRARGVDARVHYPTPVSKARAYARFAEGRHFPEAERACAELVSIPCHPELTEDEVAHLERALVEALHVT